MSQDQRSAGEEARAVLTEAREQVAQLIGAEPESVIFTSSATESNNIVLRSAALRAPQHGDQIITAATEHPSVLETLDDLADEMGRFDGGAVFRPQERIVGAFHTGDRR